MGRPGIGGRLRPAALWMMLSCVLRCVVVVEDVVCVLLRRRLFMLWFVVVGVANIVASGMCLSVPLHVPQELEHTCVFFYIYINTINGVPTLTDA